MEGNHKSVRIVARRKSRNLGFWLSFWSLLGRGVKKTCRCRHVKKICQWHIFSVDRGGYAAVASFLVCTASSFSPDRGGYAAEASILVCTAPSWIPSQSPTVTALPRGEPRAARCGHRALRNYPNTSFVSPSLRLRRHTSTFHFYRVPLLCKRKKPATQAFFFCFFIPWFR